MKGLFDFGKAATRRIVRWAIQLTVLTVAAGLALIVGFTAYAVSALPELQPWHTVRLDGEFSALRDGKLDFAGYLALEDRLFAAADAPWNRSFRLSPPQPRDKRASRGATCS